MPHDFQGTLQEFEQENGLYAYPAYSTRAKVMRFPVRVGMDLTPDARRFQYVPNNEKPEAIKNMWG